MENPIAEIPTVIRLLTQTPPALQKTALERFFIPNAEFVHPFCRVPSFGGSRWVILKIFQWYKIMSPRIELEVHAIAYDESQLKLYVTLSQIFTIWLIPFHVTPPVTLTSVIHLTTDSGSPHPLDENEPDKKLYYIAKQEDLYAVSEWIKFLIPHGGYALVYMIHSLVSLFCILGTYLLYPFMWLEDNGFVPERLLRGGNIATDVGEKISELKRSQGV